MSNSITSYGTIILSSPSKNYQIPPSLPHQLYDDIQSILLRTTQIALTEHIEQPPAYHMPNAVISITHEQSIITASIEDTIRQASTRPALIQYLQRKLLLLPDTFHKIDWSTFALSYNKIPYQQRFNLAKLIHSWQHTGVQQSHISQLNSPMCPHCSHPETAIHIFRCASPIIAIQKLEAMMVFKRELLKINTHPFILWYIQTNYFPWLTDESEYVVPPIPDEWTSPIFYQGMQEQEVIGIHLLPRGYISRMWNQIQNSARPNQNPTLWSVAFIQLLWTLSLRLWACRNQSLHQGNQEETAAKKKWLRETIEQYYVRYQHLPSCTHLFQTPLLSKLEQTDMELIKWIQTIDLLTTNNPQNTKQLHTSTYNHQMRSPTSCTQ